LLLHAADIATTEEATNAARLKNLHSLDIWQLPLGHVRARVYCKLASNSALGS
jgi:hypothetical protein